MKIYIDGYNLLHSLGSNYDRDYLIEQLRIYKRIKRADITVVFDGSDLSLANSFREKGINVVFSRGRNADDEICDMLKGKAKGVIVVTSDMTLKNRIEGMGAISVESRLFADKLIEAQIEELRGPSEEDIYREKPKKGPSKRKSKKERRKDRILPKL